MKNYHNSLNSKVTQCAVAEDESSSGDNYDSDEGSGSEQSQMTTKSHGDFGGPKQQLQKSPPDGANTDEESAKLETGGPGRTISCNYRSFSPNLTNFHPS